MNTSIFKDYDIRGIYPGQLDGEAAYRIGRAFVSLQRAASFAEEASATKAGSAPREAKRPRVVVGRDMRLSSSALFRALAKGIRDQGADVIDIGLVSTDVVYFAVGKYGFEGGIMITASHNPKEYNGFKLIGKGAAMLSGEWGIPEIKEAALDNVFPPAGPKGKKIKKDALGDYANHVLSFINPEKIKPFKIVVDAGNGMAGKIIPLIFKNLPCQIIPLYFKLDGSFPAHGGIPNPSLPNYADDLAEAVLEEKADFGAAFDGDADRMLLTDEKGNFISGDTLLAFLATYFLKKEKGARIVYNLICSRFVPDTISKYGGIPVKSRVGSAFVKELMRKKNAIFGGEVSGHFYFRDNFYSDSGFIALLIVLEILSESNRPLSETFKPLDYYFRSGEINIKMEKMEERENKMKEMEQAYSGGKTDCLDGLTMDFKDWWFNVRPSKTEPLLRLNIEAKTKELMEEKKKELVEIIKR